MEKISVHETLGEYFGEVALKPFLRKKISRGYIVPFDALITRVSQWLFEVGAILGRVYNEQLPTLAKILVFTMDGDNPEGKMCAFLREIARKRLHNYGGEPKSLLDFWLQTEWDFNLKKILSQSQQFISLDNLLDNHKLDEWLIDGIGFGAEYPTLFEQMWRNTYERAISPEKWEFAHSHGLKIPANQQLLYLKDVESDVLADTKKYVEMYFPDLIEALYNSKVSPVHAVKEVVESICPNTGTSTITAQGPIDSDVHSIFQRGLQFLNEGDINSALREYQAIRCTDQKLAEELYNRIFS